MDENIIKQIFLQHSLGEVKSVQKIEIGFTNKIYSINDKFIFKVCEKSSNEEKFSREAFLYNFFKDKIPVPEIIVFDNSKKIYDKFFMIYSKIQGNNLYSKWHLMNDSRRKDIIKQFCDILRKINESSYKDYTKRFKLSSSVNWHDKIINQTRDTLQIVKDRKLLSSEFIGVIKKFIDTNHQVLNGECCLIPN